MNQSQNMASLSTSARDVPLPGGGGGSANSTTNTDINVQILAAVTALSKQFEHRITNVENEVKMMSALFADKLSEESFVSHGAGSGSVPPQRSTCIPLNRSKLFFGEDTKSVQSPQNPKQLQRSGRFSPPRIASPTNQGRLPLPLRRGSTAFGGTTTDSLAWRKSSSTHIGQVRQRQVSFSVHVNSANPVANNGSGTDAATIDQDEQKNHSEHTTQSSSPHSQVLAMPAVQNPLNPFDAKPSIEDTSERSPVLPGGDQQPRYDDFQQLSSEGDGTQHSREMSLDSASYTSKKSFSAAKQQRHSNRTPSKSALKKGGAGRRHSELPDLEATFGSIEFDVPADFRTATRLSCPSVTIEHSTDEQSLLSATAPKRSKMNRSKRPTIQQPERFQEEIATSKNGRVQRRRKTITREAFVSQLLALSEKLPVFSRTLGSEHWLVELTDVVYIVASTVMMLVALSSFASPQQAANSHFVIGIDVIISLLTLLFAIAKTRTSTRVTEWEVIDDVKTLQSTYLKSRWFAVDLATIVPIEFIFISWAPPMVFSVCLLRHLLRLPRSITLTRSSHPLLQERQWFSILFIIAISVLVVEFAAQIFRLTESSTEQLSHADVDQGTATLTTTHMDAVYWTITTITSVGYGDLVPTTEGSKVLAMFVQLFGIAMVAGTTSVATQRLTSSDPVKTDIERRKRMMYSMLSFYDVPWGVQKEVIAQFPSLLAEHNEDQFHNLANNLPQGVGKKIEIFVRRKMVANVPLFKDLQDPSLLLEIATLLTSVIYQPQEYVFHAGEVGSEMYFIASGGVDVLVPLNDELETVVAVLRTGQWFGEIALLQDSLRTASVQAVETSELLVLNKHALLEVACRNDSLRDMIDEEIKVRLEELSDEKNRAVKHDREEEFDEIADNDDPLHNHSDGEDQNPSVVGSAGFGSLHSAKASRTTTTVISQSLSAKPTINSDDGLYKIDQ